MINSTFISIDLVSNQLISVEFDDTIDYSCEFSKNCQFFIKKVVTCIPNPKFTFNWQVSTIDLILNASQIAYFSKMQSAPDALVIPAKFFPYGEINFTLITKEKLTERESIYFLIVTIKPDPLSVSLSKASGSIGENNDLVVHAILPVDLDPLIVLSYNWICYYKTDLCSFPFNSTSSSLIISKKYSKLRLYTHFMLTVTASIKYFRRLEEVSVNSSASVDLKCEIVPGSAPEVNLIQTDHNFNSKIIPSQSPAVFKAVLKDNDYHLYTVQWEIVSEDNRSYLTKENGLTFAFNPGVLIQGRSYVLKFSTADRENNSYSFIYDFQVNSPPQFGVCSANPPSGIEFSTEFVVSCTDWQDLEGNYPLRYTFGIINEDLILNFEVLSLSSYSSMFLPYLNKNVKVFARIYDLIEDYSEVINSVEVKQKNLEIKNSTEKAQKNLDSALTSEISNQLICLSALLLNRDLYTNGSKPEPTEEYLIELTQCYGVMLNAMNKLVINSVLNPQLLDLSTGILEEMTKNPMLKSETSFNSTLSCINDMLLKTTELGVTGSQASSILRSVTNLVQFKNDTLYNETKSVKAIENLLNSLGTGMMKKSIPNNPLQANSEMLSISSTTFDKGTKVTNFQIGAQDASSVLPQEIFSFFPDIEKGGVFCGEMKTASTSNTSSSRAVLVSVFSGETTEVKSILLNQSNVTIKVPVSNTYLVKEPGCFFLNSSNQWSQNGCTVLETGKDFILCSCNHLSLFSAGGQEGFIPSNNFDQTTDISALKNITATSAIGFYFVAVILSVYLFIGIVAWKKDSKDFQHYISQADSQNAFDILKNQIADELEAENLSGHSLMNEGQIIENQSKEVRVKRQLLVQVEELKKNTKTGMKLIVEEHRLLNILFYHDPKSLRFTRCSLLFLLFLGKMYFIGLFYEKESQNQKVQKIEDAVIAYSLRDFLVMVYSVGIVIGADLFLGFITKSKVILPEMPREIIISYIKSNQRRRFFSVFLFGGLMGFYCWSIAMFALNLELSLSLRWIVNTSIGIGSDLIVNPLLKLFFKGFVLTRVILYIKLRKFRYSIYPSPEQLDINNENQRSKGFKEV